MIVYNDGKLFNYYGMAKVDERTGKVTAIGEERGREGGWFWIANNSTSSLKDTLLELDKEFTGLYDNVKVVAFGENL